MSGSERGKLTDFVALDSELYTFACIAKCQIRCHLAKVWEGGEFIISNCNGVVRQDWSSEIFENWTHQATIEVVCIWKAFQAT